jgi:hypothetical protein
VWVTVQRQKAFDVSLRSFRVGAQEFAESFLTDCACSKFEDGLCRRFLAHRKVIAIELEKKHTYNKASALVAINEVTVFVGRRPCTSPRVQ